MDLLSGLFSAIFGFFKRALDALRSLNFSTIWQFLQKIYSRFHRLIQWWQKHIMKPLDDYRQAIYRIYNLYFRPIIQVIETLRTMVRFLALFDRKLAALIDSKLAWLENLVMTPISAALKRINGISSTLRAMLTPLGMLDRVLLLESLRRDASMVWDVLTNPLAIVHDTTGAPPVRTQTDRVNDFADFVAGRGGTYQDSTDSLTLSFKNLLAGVE